jgi:1-aminocyclopropane-1-carboxylate deaminase
MHTFYKTHGVPTDFVYTAKAAFALCDLTRQGYFPSGSRILLIHTGGLQGNRSLPPNILGF